MKKLAKHTQVYRKTIGKWSELVGKAMNSDAFRQLSDAFWGFPIGFWYFKNLLWAKYDLRDFVRQGQYSVLGNWVMGCTYNYICGVYVVFRSNLMDSDGFGRISNTFRQPSTYRFWKIVRDQFRALRVVPMDRAWRVDVPSIFWHFPTRFSRGEKLCRNRRKNRKIDRKAWFQLGFRWCLDGFCAAAAGRRWLWLTLRELIRPQCAN